MNTKEKSNFKILFVFCSFEFGGAERQGLNLAAYLQQQDYNIEVWSTYHQSGAVIDQCKELSIPIRFQKFRWPCRKKSLVIDTIKFLFALRKSKCDLLLPYTTWPNMACGLTWRYSGARACIWGQRNVNNLTGHFLERFAYNNVTAVVCNSTHSVDYLETMLGKTKAPVKVINNGVKLPPSQDSRMAWRNRLSIADDALVVVMTANFRTQKDHRTLLNAWNSIVVSSSASRPCYLLLAGAKQNTYEETKQLIDDLCLNEKVLILDEISDISGLLEASDIGVLISHHEGLSNSLIEYMLSGLPVLVTDLPGNREALGACPEMQLCKPKSVSNLKKKLELMINNPAERKALSIYNQDRAHKLFSYSKMCETYMQLISNQI